MDKVLKKMIQDGKDKKQNERIENLEKLINDKNKPQEQKTEETKGTIRQSVIALYFLRQANCFPKQTGENTRDANFIFFLTGLNPDKVRKQISNPFNRPDNSSKKAVLKLIHDVTIVRNQFEMISFTAGVELADMKLSELHNDLGSFD
ncbi:hypothetical protein [Carboxylicivirga linearis]|uniref:Uncharacterized protein n=1 Tax=Carboxylicivirga linearis TaxID=1628157 RepID=A0ABS5K1T1_9BACT|nr:hypothetical protein [Carboxylicivirga linearis]MBS2101145.1 hypothetical protein [Carboxylicivirga linearis]